MVINKNYLINGRAESASRTGRDVGQVGVRAAPAIVGQVGRVGQVRQVRQVRQVGQVGQVRRVERVGVRAKASECMELGMWGRL